jgi:hypothetical protein
MKIEIKYPVKINYDRNADKPSRIFASLGKTIDTFHKVDILLANCLGSNIKVKQQLDRVEIASVTTWLLSLIEIPDDDTLKNKLPKEKDVKQFFSKGREEILSKFNGDFDLENSETYQELQKDMESIARESGILNEFSWNQLPALKVAEIYDEISNATSLLEEGDILSIGNKRQQTEITKGNIIDLVKVQESLVHKRISNNSIEKLIIKRADFLGESKWEFKLNNRRIEAKIIDKDWMHSLHIRKIKLTTGDSLLVNLRSETGLDVNNKVMLEKHEILQVIRLENSSEDLENGLFE